MVGTWARMFGRGCLGLDRLSAIESPRPLMPDLKIHPTIGYGGLHLGIDRDAVRSQLGEPDRIEKASFPDGSSREEWRYDDLGCQLEFDSDDEWLLGGIEVHHPDATLSGAKLIGMQEPVMLEALERAGVPDIELDEDVEVADLRYYASEESGLFFCVHLGALESVTVWPLYDASGNHPQWPNGADAEQGGRA